MQRDDRAQTCAVGCRRFQFHISSLVVAENAINIVAGLIQAEGYNNNLPQASPGVHLY